MKIQLTAGTYTMDDIFIFLVFPSLSILKETKAIEIELAWLWFYINIGIKCTSGFLRNSAKGSG